MKRIYQSGSIEIWEVTEAWGVDYYVYGVTRDPPGQAVQGHRIRPRRWTVRSTCRWSSIPTRRVGSIAQNR